MEGQSQLEAERLKALKSSRVVAGTASWSAYLSMAVATLVVAWPLYRGHPANLVFLLPVAGIVAGFAVVSWLSTAEVSFDADGVRVSDKYWRLRRHQPILFGYDEGIQIVAQTRAGVVWVNGVRIAAPSVVIASLEKIARNMGLGFTRVDTSAVAFVPALLTLAALASLFLVHGLLGWLLYFVFYGSSFLVALIRFVQGHGEWGAIA
ncbi:MAG TPA: hypothetical protein VF337_12740, partial [Candidatus Limnocylindrales bacterium]